MAFKTQFGRTSRSLNRRERQREGRRERERDTFGVHFRMPELKAFLSPSFSRSGQTDEAFHCHKVNTMRAECMVLVFCIIEVLYAKQFKCVSTKEITVGVSYWVSVIKQQHLVFGIHILSN